jgi:uncharacterized protein (DUF305 family)
MDHAMPHRPYLRLMLMGLLSFLSMYVLMYMMVDRLAHVHMHVNQLYMAGLMTAPMLIFELALMRGMYPNRRTNIAVLAGSLVAGVLFIAGIRMQTAVTDRQFLKSMIPHHAGAILMCEEAPLRDPAIRELCRSIVADQQAEIDWMQAKLEQID